MYETFTRVTAGNERRDHGPSRHPDWHPHFGQIGDVDVATWLYRYPSRVPMRSVMLASDERTGSEWLCQMMGNTGKLGRPSEYLNAPWMRRFLPDYPQDVPSQVAIAHRVGTTPNGCFAMKVHPVQFERMLAGTTFAQVFPSPVIVRLLRRDLLGQAISLVRARQTQRYHAHWEEKGKAVFDAREIEAALRVLAANRARWDTYFARNGMAPLTVLYEVLSDDPEAVVRHIARAAGETVKPKTQGSQTLAVQADALTETWRARFLLECGNPNEF